MRQTQLPHGTVDIPALPASILQGAGKMFADAAASHTLFGHQNDGIGRKVMDQFFLKREDAHQLINIAGMPSLASISAAARTSSTSSA